MSKQFHTMENMSLADAFKCLLENASDAIYVLDVHGNFLAVNRKAEELTGFKREYFIGKSFRKIISLKSLPKAIKGFLDVIKGKEIRLELELKTATKKTVLTEVTSRPLIINGKTVGTLGIVRDITERVSMENRLKEANRKLEMFCETAMEGITVVDAKENLTFVNKAFADILGYKEDELQGMNLRKLVDEEGFKKIRKQTETRKKGKISRYEIVLYRKDGKPRIVQVSASPLWNKDGTYAGALSIIMDVTERKNMEEKLRESEERLRLLIEYAPDAVYMNDLEGNFVDGNRQAEMLTGYKKEELIGKNFFEAGFFSEKYLPKAMDAIEKNRHGEKFGPSEFELIRKDGSTVTVEISSFPVKRGGKVEVIGIARDITERKRMERVLRESEEKYRTQFEEALDAIFIADAETGIIINCNRAASELVGREKSELVGKHQRILHLPEEIEGEFSRTFKQHLKEKEGQVLETQVITKRGEIKDVAIKANVFELRGKKLIQGIFRDIAERKKVEENLRESEERFRTLFESIQDPVGIFVGREGHLIEYNKAFKKLSGYNNEELKDKIFLDFIHPDDQALVLEKYRTEYSEEELPLVYEIRGMNKKGKAIPLEISVSTYKKRGRIIGIEVIHRDITERKMMEEKLKESEERLRNLYESVPDALAVYVGREGRLIEYNEAFKKQTGYADEELKDKTFLDFVHPDDRALVLEKYRTEYSEEELPIIYEIRTVNKKGESIPTEISVGTYKKGGRVIGINVMHRDITERKQMQQKLEEYSQQLETLVEKRTRQLKDAQEQLIKSERLAAIGQVAAMIGHDIRNPLTCINSAAYYLKTKLGPKMNKRTKEMLELIEKDVQYSNKIITDLLDYSREMQLELSETTPKSIMQDSLSLVDIPKKVQVLDSTQDKSKIKIDIEKMKRVFSNFVKNAVDAMSEGGKLAISSKESDGNVEFTFTDTGTGMAKEVMEKLWTPFFTTKAKGMGLGLAICKRIIEAHGGKIFVESIVGEGTTFTVTIPMEPKPIEKGGEKVWVNVPESLLSMMTKA